MQNTFNANAPETYETRTQMLKDKEKLLDLQLNAPSSLQPTLKPPPGTAMRMQGNQNGRNALKKQRVDLNEELAIIRKEREQRKDMVKQIERKKDLSRSI